MKSRTEKAELLARTEGFGSVSRCSRGCVHVNVHRLSLRLSPEELRELSDMAAEACDRLDDAEAIAGGVH